MVSKLPHKMDLGAVYTAQPKQKNFLSKEGFKEVEREFIIDIDLTDYQEEKIIQTNCLDPGNESFKASFKVWINLCRPLPLENVQHASTCAQVVIYFLAPCVFTRALLRPSSSTPQQTSKNVCLLFPIDESAPPPCILQFMVVAIKVLDLALRKDFGFENIFWVFSGRRGVHCWVGDDRARKMNNQVRSAVAEYLNVFKGGEKEKTKMSALQVRDTTPRAHKYPNSLLFVHRSGTPPHPFGRFLS